MFKFILIVLCLSFIFSKEILALEIDKKQAFVCDGSITRYHVNSEGKEISNSIKNKESIILYKYKLSKAEAEKGSNKGYIKFSDTSIPLNFSGGLEVCEEDDLNLHLNPICPFSQNKKPESVETFYNKCTLEKISGKFYCSMDIKYKNNSLRGLVIDYGCKKNLSPVVN